MGTWDEKSTPYTGLPALDTFDWAMAFGSAPRPVIVPGSGALSQARVSRASVTSIKVMVTGELGGHKGGNWWLIAGNDSLNRKFLLGAWCDKAGWHSRAGGICAVSNTYARLKAAALDHLPARHLDRIKDQL
jgi:hypothetical protein